MRGSEGLRGAMSVTVFTTFQPKLKGVCPKGVGPTPSDFEKTYAYIYMTIYICRPIDR